MSLFQNLTDDERAQLHKILDDRYLLVTKNRWYHFLGGAAAFLVAVFAVSWTGTRAGLSASKAEAAVRHIEGLEEQASNAVKRISRIDERIVDLEKEALQFRKGEIPLTELARYGYPGSPGSLQVAMTRWAKRNSFAGKQIALIIPDGEVTDKVAGAYIFTAWE